MIGKAMPPFADNARLNAYFLGDQTCAAAFGRQQHYLRPLQVALRRARGPAARLKHFAYLRPEPNFSCFGNHPDLEIIDFTRKEKWVLVQTAATTVAAGLVINLTARQSARELMASSNLNNIRFASEVASLRASLKGLLWVIRDRSSRSCRQFMSASPRKRQTCCVSAK